MKNTNHQRGFTLVELLIVIVVIAILALIVIPRINQANLKAKESTLKSNLHNLRTAVEMYRADTGAYPTQLADIIAATAPTEGIDENLQPIVITAGTYHGPYLTPSAGLDASHGIPLNPFAPSGRGGTIDEHWTYPVNGVNGKVISAVTGTTLSGISFVDL